ncbi:hypothetical protein AOC36_09700 [Erysipelothrix larvae]|uniref:Uncharacterized protein n=1 Tax=Erysipelothrix larvae TaxID=1514105 RepID=A0A109UHG3_9FIRM|nr:hypothetical protein [Erysipelothrix larvae]AMC94247.1 hypothetical protein AOC36_09700 [Erysipelothrix larvae]
MTQELILNSKGNPKRYIYVTDIRNYMQCGIPKSKEIFSYVKDYELETYQYEMFENRVPQELFHEWRRKKRRAK